MLSADVSVQVLWVGTGAAAGVSGVSLLAALVGSSWLASAERLPNPAYRNGSSKVEYLTRRTVSGLFTLCVTEGEYTVQVLVCCMWPGGGEGVSGV